MPTLSEILDALQFDLSLLSNPLNTTADPAYVIEYQFATTSQPADLWNAYTGWTALSAAEKSAVRDAMDHIETFLNVTFTEVTGSADPDMNIGKVDLSGSTAGYGGYRYSAWSDGTLADYDNFAVFKNTIDLTLDSSFDLILHEIGHALTLKHPFSGGATLPAAFENNKYSIMSYTVNPDTGDHADAMMLYDIYALQDRWGATTSYNHGDTVYTAPRFTVDPLWDTGGRDTIDGASYGGGVNIDLREGYFSRLGSFDDIVIPYGVEIEDGKGGAGNDSLTGNDLGNELTGREGNDSIMGLAGNDSLSGDAGNDTLFGNQGLDTLLGQGGDDKLDGGLDADSVSGGDGSDTVIGGGGFDTLRGGNGDDTVNGGDGRDLAYLGGGNDLFIDNAQGGVNGRDTVYANAGNDTLGGGNGNDVFHGQDGNDRMLGRLGNDKLFGGNQNDTLVGGDGNDTVAGGNGRDRAFMGNGNDSWFDNDQVTFGDDFVVGGNGDDTIRMGGGNDTASGGAGADTFIFAETINEDVITDYEIGVDALQIDATLWGGALTQAHLDSLIDTAILTDLVLNFDGIGNVLTLTGITSSAGLLSGISLV